MSNPSWGFCHARLVTGGGVFTPAKATLLKADGVTHVINCRREPDRLLLGGPFSVLHNPTEDNGEPKPPSWFFRSIDFALGALAHPKAVVYAHCFEGNNRGPSTALAILLAQGIPFQVALTRVLEARPGADVRYRNDAQAAVEALGYV